MLIHSYTHIFIHLYIYTHIFIHSYTHALVYSHSYTPLKHGFVSVITCIREKRDQQRLRAVTTDSLSAGVTPFDMGTTSLCTLFSCRKNEAKGDWMGCNTSSCVFFIMYVSIKLGYRYDWYGMLWYVMV